MKSEALTRKGILKIPPYVPGKPIEEVEKEFGKKRWVKLASNENLLGPSPKAVKAIKKELPKIYLYPEGPCTLLKQSLAQKFFLPEESIVVSNGADNLILMIACAFVNEGEEVMMADPTFPVYSNVTQIMGGKTIRVRLKNYTHDLERMGERVTQKTKLIFICNPNNPTGTIVSKKVLDSFLSGLPSRVIVILDEAYREFVDDPDFPDGIDYVREGRAVIVLRTFSKVYGLAGLRIGYALGPKELIHCLNQVRDPFPVHRLAQVAAIAALGDERHAKRSIQMVQEGRRYLSFELEKMGLNCVPSQANFLFVDFKRDIESIFQNLLREGIIIRPGKIWGYPTCGRITIGRMEDNKRFIRAVRKILKR